MIEIRIRVLMKNDMGMDVVPSTTLVAEKAPSALDVAAIADRLVKELNTPLLGKLRPMTNDEADAYCAEEDADDGYTDLGLSDSDLERRT